MKTIQKMQRYVTVDLKLASLLISEIPGCSFEIDSQNNSLKKNISIIYPEQLRPELDDIVRNYINRTSRVDVSKYNRNLNLLRDALRDY